MIRYNLYGVNPVSLLLANISEYQLAILFNLPVVEYFVTILGHQHDVVGDLTVAMAKAAQFQAYHILAIGGWHRLWLRCQVQHHLKKKQCFINLRKHKERARVHFIPDLKVGVFVTLRAPDVIIIMPVDRIPRL
jgi:hypothetical protein